MFRTLVRQLGRTSFRPPTVVAPSAASLELKEELAFPKVLGFYTATLGQRIGEGDKEYEILRKLGYGCFSTVWLARRVHDDTRVALKILTQNATAGQVGDQMDEYGIMLRIDQDWHPCLPCMGVYGRNPRSVGRMGGKRALPITWVKKMTKQLLLALDYLHSECGVIHSDVKPENILWDYGIRAEDIIQQALLEPTAPVPKVDETSTIRSQELFHPDITNIDDIHMRLCDYGYSNWTDLHFHDNICSPALRPPETILGYPFDTSADIWSFGCTIFELLVGKSLFHPSSGSQGEIKWTYNHHHLVEMLCYTQQKFPEKMLSQSKCGSEYLTDNGGSVRILKRTDPQTLEEILLLYDKLLSPEEAKEANIFLMKSLQLNPGKRATAKELLQDPWLES